MLDASHHLDRRVPWKGFGQDETLVGERFFFGLEPRDPDKDDENAPE
jgi:hypothetical protein